MVIHIVFIANATSESYALKERVYICVCVCVCVCVFTYIYVYMYTLQNVCFFYLQLIVLQYL